MARITPPEMAPEARPSPFFLVWSEDREQPTRQHPSYASAMRDAKQLATQNIGVFHVLAVVATTQLRDLTTEEFAVDLKHEAASHPRDCRCDDCEIPF